MAHKLLKIGELVSVTDWEGKILKRVVVENSEDLIFVCTEKEYKEASNQGREPLAVGWPRDAVLSCP